MELSGYIGKFRMVWEDISGQDTRSSQMVFYPSVQSRINFVIEIDVWNWLKIYIYDLAHFTDMFYRHIHVGKKG